MFGWADTNWLRVCGYLLVAILCFAAAKQEDRDSVGAWPPFWILTGVLFVVMAAGRAGDLADLMTDAMRQRAVSEGWYERRRHIQGMVVAALAGTWLLTVLVAIWRVPERRRRYLPMIVIVLTIGFYAAVRIVSLHQLDAVLHRRQAAGMRYGTIFEYVLLLAATACAVWTPRRRLGTRPESPLPATASVGDAQAT
jgi:hypothetical protein